MFQAGSLLDRAAHSRSVKRFKRGVIKDIENLTERAIPGVSTFEDNFPGATRELKREFRALLPTEIDRRRNLDFSPEFEEDILPRRKSRRKNMPNVKPTRRRGNFRSAVKSHSRNIKTNLSMSGPLGTVAKRSQYAEVKHHTGTVSAGVTGSIINLSPVPQGPTGVDRTGDEIKALELGFNYVVHTNPLTTGTLLSEWRLIIFQWKQNNSNVPTPADILYNVPAGLASQQFYNSSRRPTFQVLYDSGGNLAGPYAAANDKIIGQNVTGLVKAKIKIPRSVMVYDEPSSTNGTNQVYAYFGSSGTSASPLLDTTWRLTFIDS